MGFRAVHAQWGTVFAHLPDLGCGRSWEEVWKVRPPEPIVCVECLHPMYAKTSSSGLRFFAHAPHAPDCEIARQGESEAHHLLKLELTNAARDAGAHAEMEVRAADGSWRADVLATDPGGTWSMALEAQLSPITAVDIAARTERMAGDGVTACWFSDRPQPPWLGTVPSVRLAPADTGGLAVTEGLVKFERGSWTVPADVGLADFLRWVFTGRVVQHAPRTGLRYPLRKLPLVWTAPQYVAAEDRYLVEQAERDRLQQERQAAYQRKRERERAAIRAKNEISRARALRRATVVEETVRRECGGVSSPEHSRITARPGVRAAVDYLAERGITAAAGFSFSQSRWAGGVPLVGDDGVPVAVLSPEPSLVRSDAFLLLAGMLLLFQTRAEHQRFDRNTRRRRMVPTGGYQVELLSADPAAPPSAAPPARPHRRTGATCSCRQPSLAVTIARRQYPAKPSTTMGPAATLFIASCLTCGGRYDKPWRRTITVPQQRAPDGAATVEKVEAHPQQEEEPCGQDDS
ncbi:competence protein CoiA family protein [Streptomyces sp. NPDC088733]|uniref:competence protein CoiA family protein n=1 Tax=Streptomyces sp. NPDC088733 TaxID=3365880 RepID=UPI003825A183